MLTAALAFLAEHLWRLCAIVDGRIEDPEDLGPWKAYDRLRQVCGLGDRSATWLALAPWFELRHRFVHSGRTFRVPAKKRERVIAQVACLEQEGVVEVNERDEIFLRPGALDVALAAIENFTDELERLLEVPRPAPPVAPPAA